MPSAILSILVIITALIATSLYGEKKDEGSGELRTVLPTFEGLSKLDPHLVVNATQSVLVSNMYANLLTTDLDTGEILGGLAKKFYWEKNVLVLELRDDFRTATGLAIDTDDVNLSLKRLILVSRKHNRPIGGRLDHLLCPTFKKFADSCSNVKLVDKHIIRLTFPDQRAEFAEILTGETLFVVHKSSFDLETLDLKSHQDSTGAYFASKSKGDKDTLIANPKYWTYNPAAPHRIRLIDEILDPKKTSEAFLKDQIDFITELSVLRPKDYEELNDKVKNSDIFRTNELSSTLLQYTNRGLKLPVDVRREISRAMLQCVRKYKQNLSKYRSANNQFLVPGGYGSLTEDMLKQVEILIDKKSDISKLPKIKLAIHPAVRDVYRKTVWPELDHLFEYIDLKETTDFENKSADDEKQPHLYFIATDLAFYENFWFVSYMLRRDSFSVRGKAADKWLDKYMAEPVQVKREEMLRKVHYESILENPSFIPLFTKPYISIVRNGWKLKFSKNSSLFYFNRIVKE